jgi:hypothetical protein
VNGAPVVDLRYIEADGGPMADGHRLTDAALAEIRRRRASVRASLACEGMVLTAEEEALFDAMERERLSPDERAARITQLGRAKRRQKAAASA